ncbi:hypothetical protein D3C85_1679590 [compost metagenome]
MLIAAQIDSFKELSHLITLPTCPDKVIEPVPVPQKLLAPLVVPPIVKGDMVTLTVAELEPHGA